MTTDQLSLLGPTLPRYRASSPASREGAETVAPHVGGLQRKVLRALQAAGERGLTYEEMEERTGIRRTTCIPRLHELQDKGLVHPKPIGRRKAPSGVRVSVWGLTEKGRRV